MTADRTPTNEHGITDPTAPPGWQCGDPSCPEHGVARFADRTPTSEGPRTRQVPVLREALSLGAPDILEIVGDRLGLIVNCLNASGYRIAASPEERGGGGDAPAIERIVADMPWPASCRHCPLVTEDPDAFFRPNDWDPDSIPDDVACPGSPSGVHECRDLHDYGLTRRVRATPAAPSEPAPLDVERLREIVRDLTDEHGWPKSAVGFDAFIDAIGIEYARLQSTPTPTEADR